MSCSVLDFELADKNVFKELGVLIDGKIRDTHFLLQKSTHPQNKRFGAQATCTEVCVIVDVWITVSFRTIFLELSRANNLQKD